MIPLEDFSPSWKMADVFWLLAHNSGTMQDTEFFPPQML